MPINLPLPLKALRDLGLEQVGLFALYRLGLRLGLFRRVPKPITNYQLRLAAEWPLPSRESLRALLGDNGQRALLAEADEIVAGNFRIFGGGLAEINLAPPPPLRHWTAYETSPATRHPSPDIKLLWEPARFGWATVLARAYHLSRDDKYAESFWDYTEKFLLTNPPYLGPNWVSAQEAGIRILAWTFAGSLFREADSTTEPRARALAEAIAVHAERIPPTLVYARSQNNNHLLSEAAGLITAGLVLPDHPRAKKWLRLGRKWMNRALEKQIDGYGEYSQHSANYHRLMLQTALWVNALDRSIFTSLARKNLARASHWLASILDSESGGVPNLGANDGAYLLPLTIRPFNDFRPIVQGAARAFLQYDIASGDWDEMSLWFGLKPVGRSFTADHYLADNLRGRESWAYLRTTRFTSRPGHADLLHLDLWWRGINITRDAGTFSYNAAPPWDNPLTATRVHNTVTVDSRDQMTRAGRFLYVDWADAYSRNEIDSDETIVAKKDSWHRAYRNPNITHRRTVTVDKDERWVVFDRMHFENLKFKGFEPIKSEDIHIFRLHWLFPDWKWEISEAPFDETEAAGYDLRLLSPHGWITIRLCADLFMLEMFDDKFKVGMARAGQLIWGDTDVLPTDGWFSPTYGMKEPALSFSITAACNSTAEFSTVFMFDRVQNFSTATFMLPGRAR